MEKKLSIRHEFYESTIGCGPCEAWQGPIDVAEAKISLPGGKTGYAMYRKEAVIPAEVSYSINETSYFAKGFNSKKAIESYSRLDDAKKSEFYPVFRQLLDTVKEATKARKNGK